MMQILCSGFDLGQDSALLTKTYETVMKTLVKIDHTFARGEQIDGSRLREYFGKRESVFLSGHIRVMHPLTCSG